MKKWIAFFWLIVSMLATFFPCCTDDECGAVDVDLQLPKAKNCKSAGACSPFITCGTCPGFTQTAKTVEVAFFSSPKLVHQTRIVLLTPSCYTPSLFQPPRAV
ncbi:MAG: hypothetical protein INR73_20180 [Williamsia sp.]|nr:hypothetical protein [Williamsia sp.]